MKYIPRFIEPVIWESSQTFKVVFLGGYSAGRENNSFKKISRE